jgi:hypothetical protein
MRIEDIVDEYWMRQLANFFNRRGLVKLPLRMNRNSPNYAEGELDNQVTTAGYHQNSHEDSPGFETSTHYNEERLLIDDT